MASLLLVEDDELIRRSLVHELSDLGHAVRSVDRALEALREVTDGSGIDAIVLDLGLPDLEGGELLKMMRAVTDTPVVVATAREGEKEVIRLLRCGADDYLVKPFSAEHLDARLQAVLRRAKTDSCPGVIEVGGLRIDNARREASLDGAEVQLTRREFDLLEH